MRYQFKAFQFSLAFHALILFIFLGMNTSSVAPTSNVIIVDFSVEDSINGENSGAGSPEDVGAKPEHKPKIKERKQEVICKETEKKEKQLEIAESKEVIIPTPTLDTQIQTSGEVAILADTEPTDYQYESLRSIQANFSTSKGDALKSRSGGGGQAGKSTGLTSRSGYGNSDSDMLYKSRYLKKSFSYIRDMIQKKVNYPEFARQMGWEGRVTISFIVSVTGSAKDIKIKQSSGVDILDRSAIEAVKNASPFPEPPVEAKIIIPITYKLD